MTRTAKQTLQARWHSISSSLVDKKTRREQPVISSAHGLQSASEEQGEKIRVGLAANRRDRHTGDLGAPWRAVGPAYLSPPTLARAKPRAIPAFVFRHAASPHISAPLSSAERARRIDARGGRQNCPRSLFALIQLPRNPCHIMFSAKTSAPSTGGLTINTGTSSSLL